MMMTDEERRIEEWRVHELERLGFRSPDAELFAHVDVDLHDLENLINSGCAPYLAIRILWPI